MVVGNLDIECLTVSPYKAYPPLIIDADAVLALAVARQGFQPVARRLAQVVKSLGGVDRQELGSGSLLNLRRQPANGIARKDRSGAFVAERLDHAGTYRTTLRNVNRNVPQGSTVFA